MFQTKFKPAEEIRYSLRNYRKVAIFSCGFCSNLSDVAGARGKNLIKSLCEEWGKEVVVAKVVSGCCLGSTMEAARRVYLKRRLSKIEALIVISCAGGVKSAWLYNPGLPVIAACDSFGSRPLTIIGRVRDDLVIDGTCPVCDDGHCVLSFTAGICPITECPLKCRYGFCDQAPKEGMQCPVDLKRDCVWKTIEIEVEKRGGSLAALQELKRIHEDETVKRMPSLVRGTSPTLLRKLAGRVTAGIPGPITEGVHLIR